MANIDTLMNRADGALIWSAISVVKTDSLYEPNISSWTWGTDEEIDEILTKLENGSMTFEETGWRVGDERVVDFSAVTESSTVGAQPAQTVTLVILSSGKYNTATRYLPVEHTFSIGFKNCLSSLIKADSSEEKWSYYKSFLLTSVAEYASHLPSYIYNHLKPFTIIYVDNEDDAKTYYMSPAQKLHAFAIKELYSYKDLGTFYANGVPRYEFIKNTDFQKFEYFGDYFQGQKRCPFSHKARQGDGSTNFCRYWTRTPYTGGTNRIICGPSNGWDYEHPLRTETAGVRAFGLL